MGTWYLAFPYFPACYQPMAIKSRIESLTTAIKYSRFVLNDEVSIAHLEDCPTNLGIWNAFFVEIQRVPHQKFNRSRSWTTTFIWPCGLMCFLTFFMPRYLFFDTVQATLLMQSEAHALGFFVHVCIFLGLGGGVITFLSRASLFCYNMFLELQTRSWCYASNMFLELQTRSWCYASNMFLELQTRSLLTCSWNFRLALDATLLACSWNFRHALDATLLTCSWNFRHALDATLLTAKQIR